MSARNSTIRGFHVSPAIPPHCAEKRTRAELIGPSVLGGDRVLLRDLEMGERGVSLLIDCDRSSFVPDSEAGKVGI